MAHDSELNFALFTNPLAGVILDPENGQVLAQNIQAKKLFATSLANRPLSDVLISPRVDAAVFFEATIHFGRYLDAGLAFQTAKGDALRLHTYGSYVPTAEGERIMLTFLDLAAQEKEQYKAETNAHHRAGFFQWQSVFNFFQEVEAQNRLILDAAGEGIYGINAEGKATFVNQAAQDMLGWDAEDLIGRELHSIIHHHHLDGQIFPAHECPIYHTFRKDKTQRVENDAFWRKDGKPILVEYVSTPIYDQNVLAGAVVIFRDVTERKENERKLRDALAEVEKLRLELEEENDYLLTEIRSERSHKGILGQSAAVRNLKMQIDLVAETSTNILVTGQRGTGKSLTVSAIHEASDRRKRPLVKVDCAISWTQAREAEFFGYRKGAYRGAARDTVGQIALAQNGTLHFDEVSMLPADMQTKLKDVLQTETYRRIGDAFDTNISLTIISTTTTDLQAEVNAGRFRADLFFALSVFPMRCEPLNQRVEDIPHLAQHFLELITHRLQLPPARLSNANMETLKSYGWPGNVRELQNVIERAAILGQGGKLRFEFNADVSALTHQTDQVLTDADLRALERSNLVNCLRRTQGRVSGGEGAAAILGLAPTTVYSRIKSLNVDRSEWSDL